VRLGRGGQQGDEAVADGAAPVDVVVPADELAVGHVVAPGQEDVAHVAIGAELVAGRSGRADLELAALHPEPDREPRVCGVATRDRLGLDGVVGAPPDVRLELADHVARPPLRPVEGERVDAVGIAAVEDGVGVRDDGVAAGRTAHARAHGRIARQARRFHGGAQRAQFGAQRLDLSAEGIDGFIAHRRRLYPAGRSISGGSGPGRARPVARAIAVGHAAGVSPRGRPGRARRRAGDRRPSRASAPVPAHMLDDFWGGGGRVA